MRIPAFAAGDRAWGAAGAVFVVTLVVLGFSILRAPWVGLADNGDWDRYSCPVGLSGEVRFDQLPSTLVPQACPAFDYRSTNVAFLEAAKAVEVPIAGAVHLRHLAGFWSVVISLGWAALAFEVARASGRAGRATVAVGVAAVIGSDVAFSATFGSIYAEAMIIALLPAAAALVVRSCRRASVGPAALVAGSVVLVAITAAKPTMALTAVLASGVVAIVRRRVLRPVVLSITAVVAAGLLVFSAAAIADPTFSEWNTYNLAFTAVVPESDDPHQALRDIGLDARTSSELERFIGVPFGPDVTEGWDRPELQAFRARGRGGVLASLVRRPKVWWRMLGRTTTGLDDLHLDYLSNHSGTAGDVLLAARPHPAQLVLLPASRAGPLLPIAGAVIAILLLGRLWRRTGRSEEGPDGSAQDRGAPLLALLTFATAMAASQQVLALADGSYEVAKHLTVAGFLLATTVSGAMAWAAGSVFTHARDRRSGVDSIDGVPHPAPMRTPATVGDRATR